MPQEYRLSTGAKFTLGVAVAAVPIATVAGIFALTDDTMHPHQQSKLAEQYTSQTLELRAGSETMKFSPIYGKADGTHALVLYDPASRDSQRAETYAIVAGNLATHFGSVEIKTIDHYNAGDLNDHDALIYVGTDHTTDIPQALAHDVTTSDTNVLWIGENMEDLAQAHPEQAEGFVEHYGWDPTQVHPVASTDIDQITYDGVELNRYEESDATRTVDIPEVVDQTQAKVLATGTQQDATEAGEEHPWIIRSGNLTHVVELPYHYIDRNELYLAYSDLYFDLLAPDTAPSARAAVRLEDVNPESSPEQLRAIADYLHSQDVPFQVAVIPVMIDRAPNGDDEWYGMSLLDKPKVIEALKYMQERGGTLIQHGTTHQYGATDNPYSGRTGDDYEFYGYGCSATEHPPYEWETCVNDSWVRKTAPVPADRVADHRARINHGRNIMIEAGLGEPTIFETPHYTASVNAYTAMAETHEARYEQVEYYSGMLNGSTNTTDFSYGQIFPYTVHDIYGTTVYPENLQNPTLKDQNNHPARSPQDLIDRAAANLVVTESTASFYFHPFLDMKYLKETITGIQDLGYDFVTVSELD